MAKLSASDWVRAGLEVLADEGLGSLAVEPLARRLGVTKGSFYWHFRDRATLLAAVLSKWEERETLAVIERLNELPNGQERLTQLFRRALEDQVSARHYLALAAASSAEPLVREVLQRITARRLDYIAECYTDMGAAQPRLRAQVAYAAYVGTMHLARELISFTPDYVDGVINTLISSPNHTHPY